jgi:hypothetical protein
MSRVDVSGTSSGRVRAGGPPSPRPSILPPVPSNRIPLKPNNTTPIVGRNIACHYICIHGRIQSVLTLIHRSVIRFILFVV